MNVILRILSVLLFITASVPSHARLNDKVINRPYADNRAWHLGFSVGTYTLNFAFTHNGFISDEGKQWMIEQPAYSPGFCVNGLIDFRLSNYFNVRFSPGMYFGNRDLKMLDATTGETERQNLKSTFVVLPVDLKYSALRYNNMRPYVLTGIMPAFDVTKRQGELLQLKPMDFYLSVGFGCDFYLPFFKLIPEVKFCFGLTDVLQHNRPDLADDAYKLQFTQSLAKATSKMIVLTFYFE